MDVKIVKSENDTKLFSYNESNYNFDYDSLSLFIDTVIENEDDINIICEEGLEEYKNLLEEIVESSRTEDFKKAVIAAKESANELAEVTEGDVLIE